MQLVYKGKCKNIKALPESELPENAVTFREPKNALTLNLTAFLFCIPPRRTAAADCARLCLSPAERLNRLHHREDIRRGGALHNGV